MQNDIKREFLKAVISGDQAMAINLREQLKPIHGMKIIAHSGAYQVEGKTYTIEELKSKMKQLQRKYSICYHLLDIEGRTDIIRIGHDQPTVSGMHIY